MNSGKALKIIGKNLLAFLGGAILGIASSIFLFFPRGLERISESGQPLAAIALIPLFLIIYGLLGAVIGGLAGVVIYNAVKLIFKKKS